MTMVVMMMATMTILSGLRRVCHFFAKWSLIPGMNCYAIYAYVPTTMMIMMMMMMLVVMMMTTMMMMMTIVIAIAMTCHDFPFFAT
jgi:hypothetical protein